MNQTKNKKMMSSTNVNDFRTSPSAMTKTMSSLSDDLKKMEMPKSASEVTPRAMLTILGAAHVAFCLFFYYIVFNFATEIVSE